MFGFGVALFRNGLDRVFSLGIRFAHNERIRVSIKMKLRPKVAVYLV
jgi:hypothetical protein